MPKALEWDKVGERLYKIGVDKVVLFPMTNGTYESGVAWNGVTNANENPSGAEKTDLYADNQKYLTLMSAEEFGLTLECYMQPDEFAECDGSKEVAEGVYVRQQTRKPFGLSYRTKIGNDTEQDNHGYKIHLVYNCLTSPSEEDNQTINDSPEAGTYSFEITTTPVAVSGQKPTAHLVIDSTKADPDKLASFETILYGSNEADARLMLPDDVIDHFTSVGG